MLAEFEIACTQLQSGGSDSRQAAEQYLLQLRESGKSAPVEVIGSCQQILQHSAHPGAQFQAAVAIRDIYMRDWNSLPVVYRTTLRTQLLEFAVAKQCSESPVFEPYVRKQLLQVVALSYKRAWVDKDSETSRATLLQHITQLLSSDEKLQSLALQLMAAVTSEFSFSGLTTVGLTWEFHVEARRIFQDSALKQFFGIAAECIGQWLASNQFPAEELLGPCLTLLSTALSWNFHETASASMRWSSMTDSSSGVPDLRPGPGWRSLTTGAASIQLSCGLFWVAANAAGNPTACVAREALLGYSTLSGDVFESAGHRTAFQLHFWQQTLSWVAGIAAQRPGSIGDELSAGCLMLKYMTGHDIREALCIMSDAELQSLLSQFSELTALCLSVDYPSAAALMQAAELWLADCVSTIMKVWVSLLPGGDSGGTYSPGGARSFGDRGAVLDQLLAQLTPSIFETYVSWKLLRAAGEAEAEEEEEIEFEWENLLNQHEDDDGAESETRLASRIGQYQAAHGLGVVTEALKQTASKIADGGPVEQEQLCAVIEMAAALLTGRPRLASNQRPLRGRSSRVALPVDIRLLSSGTGGEIPILTTIQTLQEVATHIIELLQQSAGAGPSPLLGQTLLEALAAICFSYVGVEEMELGVNPALLAALNTENSNLAQFVEFMISVALQMLRGWYAEPGVVDAASTLLLTISGKICLRPYLLTRSEEWMGFHAAVWATDSESSASQLESVSLKGFRVLVEALCRVGSVKDEHLASAREAYFEPINQRIGGTILAAASSAADGQTMNSGQIVLLLKTCAGMRGIAAAAEAHSAQVQYTTMIAPWVRAIPCSVDIWMSTAVLASPEDERTYAEISIQLLKLFGTIAENYLVYMGNEQSNELYTHVLQLLHVIAKHSSNMGAVKGGGTLELQIQMHRYRQLNALLVLVCHFSDATLFI
jgi:hypothetical protein